jgi:hypothetical protein
MLELVFSAATTPDNPFDTYLLRLEITDPNGKKFPVDGFFDGDGKGGQQGTIWKVRICPYASGEWAWQTVKGDAYDSRLDGLKGKFLCTDNGDPGGVIAEKKHFRFQDGDYIYLQGTFLDFAHGLRTTHTFMSETTTDAQREQIIERHVNFHRVNKFNIYLANRGDYESQSVTPWLGNASSNDKTRMDLPRWEDYDAYLSRIKGKGMFAEIWFFADDSNFGSLSQTDKNRLFRYAMARTSAFSNTLYVIALEWGEEWEKDSIAQSGSYIQVHNPWQRLLSVHNIEPSWWGQITSIPRHTYWAFPGETWATFIATQAGNEADSSKVNQLAEKIHFDEAIPHIGEEFGHLNSDSDFRVRANMWANFCGGAAGGGTGSDIRAFFQFLEQSRVPFHRMRPANGLVESGGSSRFCLADEGHHYIVYSTSGAFTLDIKGSSLNGHWFNPRDPQSSLSAAFKVPPGKRLFTPPADSNQDWVLFVSDYSNPGKGSLYPSKDASIVRALVNM